MDLKLKPFDFAAAVARAGLRTDGTPIVGGASALNKTSAVGGTTKADFGTAMANALKSVSDQQNESIRQQQELQMDNPTVSLEQTMVTLQKTQIGFQAALSVRNRLVQFYTDVMNMQV